MEIRSFRKADDEDNLMKLIESEGEDWKCYSDDKVSDKYRAALESSITYVAYEGDILCGYSRAFDDYGLYIFVCDLLVMPKYRGKGIGRKLMECINADYQDRIIYVLSDVDKYYEKLGYQREGSVFEVSGSCR